MSKPPLSTEELSQLMEAIKGENPLEKAHRALRAALPLLIRLGDFIGNKENRCEAILLVREALAEDQDDGEDIYSPGPSDREDFHSDG